MKEIFVKDVIKLSNGKILFGNVDDILGNFKKDTREIEVGKVYEGVVTRITPFGAFVDLGGGKEGLLHISKISSKHINKVEDVLNIGDEIKAKVTDIDRQGKIALNMKDLEHHEEE